MAPAGLPVVTRGRQAPGETRGEVTQGRAWTQEEPLIIPTNLDFIPLNFLGFLEMLDFSDGFCVIGIKLQLLFLLQGAESKVMRTKNGQEQSYTFRVWVWELR